MRIGMVTACYKPVINGVTRMVSLYKLALEAQGHEVYVFTLGEPDPAGDEPNVIRSAAVPLWESGYYVSTGYSSEARQLMQEMEIIHCHHLFMSVEMAHRYARCPIVYTNHTRYDLYTGTYTPFPQPAADALMRRIWPEFTDFADVVITPSQSVKQVMRDFGVKRPLIVIDNGVDLRPFHHPPNPHNKNSLSISEDAILLAYVGRLSAEKNLHSLLKQVAVARDIVPTIQLMLIGSGPGAEKVSQQAQALHLQEHVHFIGAIPFEQVPNYLTAADMFVTASESEVHPLTVIEAMAAGLPVVAPASPGIVETVVPGQSGLLTRHLEGGLAAAIVGLAMNEPLRKEMGRAAREASRRFDIEKTVARTVALYEQLRQERPDLRREREHGRWMRRERSRPLVQQLGQLIGLSGRADGRQRRWWDVERSEETPVKEQNRE